MAGLFGNTTPRSPLRWSLAASSPEHSQAPGQIPQAYRMPAGSSIQNPPSSLTMQQKIGRQMQLGDQRKVGLLERMNYARSAASSDALSTGQTPTAPNLKPLQQQLQQSRRQRGRKG